MLTAPDAPVPESTRVQTRTNPVSPTAGAVRNEYGPAIVTPASLSMQYAYRVRGCRPVSVTVWSVPTALAGMVLAMASVAGDVPNRTTGKESNRVRKTETRGRQRASLAGG
jgi:hypothetical protein